MIGKGKAALILRPIRLCRTVLLSRKEQKAPIAYLARLFPESMFQTKLEKLPDLIEICK